MKSLEILKIDCIDALSLIIKLTRSDEIFINTVSMGLLPYLAVVVEGLDKLMEIPMDNYEDLGRFSFEQLYKRSRARTKIYSTERLNKNLYMIGSVIDRAHDDLIKDYNWIQRKYIEFLDKRLWVYHSLKTSRFTITSLGIGIF